MSEISKPPLGGTPQQRTGWLTDEFTVAPGAIDPFTALLLQDLGFTSLYLGGNAIGTQLGVGQPMVTMSEAVDSAMRITRVVNVPLIVDAGAGFGDAAHTYRTVREFEKVGVAGIHIDDQPAPKRAHYHRGQGRVIEIDEYTDKLEVALDARQGEMLIIGKTDALRLMSLAETVHRCERIVETGVDALLIVDLVAEQASVVRSEFPDTPLIWLGGHKGPVPPVREVEDAGFCLAVYPFTSIAAIAKALKACWADVVAGGCPALSEEAELKEYRSSTLDLVGMGTYWDIESRTTERRG